MICCGQDLAAEIPLLFCLLVHHPINVETLLLLEQQVVDHDPLALTNAHGATHGLLHEGRSPPWTTEDDALEVLEVEADTSTLELDQENLVLVFLHMCLLQDLSALGVAAFTTVGLDQTNLL